MYIRHFRGKLETYLLPLDLDFDAADHSRASAASEIEFY